MITTLKLLLWLIPIGANVWADRTGRKPNYLLMFILRGMAWILHMALWVPGDWAGTDFEHWVWLKLILWPTIFDLTSFWILFELGLNAFRHKGPLYYDHKEGDSGWIDRLFKWAGPKWHTAAKLLALAAMILAITRIYQTAA
jgi:hypothetical protein